MLAAGLAVFFARRDGSEPERAQPVPLAADAVAVVQRFVQTAVARRNTGASYDLVTPRLRRGYTRAEWARGSIPIVPYPARRVEVVVSRVRYPYARTALLEVVLRGPPGEPEAFRVGLVKLAGRWLVRSWQAVSRITPPEG